MSQKPALCAGCGGKISDRYYLLAVDKQWHLRCLKCCECKLALESELTCFAKDGSIYCKEDYYRYSNQSPRVQKHIPSQGVTNRNALFSTRAFKGSFSQSTIP
uniref:LIM zinc-binding domain-containing protein n=1 Tax=Athene cunicularia TaxID=194338 RepID=A0A663MKZ3_ATHCN